ncbi:hypothetical protein [Acinetobacter boissieri]|uniref:Uncharacterized protein n=1 Tax=Acinetobacter boissieri TaxID=1219383 RepID=A0A1G6GZ56_9GAMM|nr:hypothetical protein [Acinetobacter boissieri]SDB86965.1 hypothetical protein SAMN05421733_10324 [Acinetobacter boissieri]
MTTKVLGETVGIQWQGVQDRTQGQPTSNGMPLLIGSFKRGRLDRPMIIHNGNIQSELGYEPHNPDYIAVQSMLDLGVPSVSVLRLSNVQDMDCINPISVFEIPGDSDGMFLSAISAFEIKGTLYNVPSQLGSIDQLISFEQIKKRVDYPDGGWDWKYVIQIYNLTSKNMKVKLYISGDLSAEFCLLPSPNDSRVQ